MATRAVTMATEATKPFASLLPVQGSLGSDRSGLLRREVPFGTVFDGIVVW
jgi:hypothetical protein